MFESRPQIPLYRRVSVVAVLATALLSWLFGALASQAQPLAPAAGGWSFTDVAREGQNGFTALFSARIGANGTLVVQGTRVGDDAGPGLYQIQAGAVITIARPGTVLSGTLGVISSISDFAVDGRGRVLFLARVTDADPPVTGRRVYRWERGVISRMKPDERGFEHNLGVVTNAGEWIVSQFIGSGGVGTRHFYLTDGVTPTLRLSAAENTVCDYDSTKIERAVPADNQVVLYVGYQKVSSPPGSCNNANYTVNWKLDVSAAGTATQTRASGVGVYNTATGPGLDGEDLRLHGPTSLLVNDQGAIVFGKVVRTKPAFAHHQLVKVDGSGAQVLFDSDASDFTDVFSTVTFDSAGRVALTAQLDNGRFGLFAGPTPADAIILTGDTLFGQTVTNISEVSGSAPPGVFGDNRSFVFRYQLNDGTVGIALAAKGVTRWINPAGGRWDVAANWTPAEAPDAATETLFNLDATYTVTVGGHNVGRVRIEDGFVAFEDANLTLLGPLSVGDDATFDLASGTLDTGELIVGSLPPTDPLNPATAHVQISNPGAVLTGTTAIAIGHAAPGSMFLDNGEIYGGSLVIGANFPGRATLSGEQANWFSAGATAVGDNYTGTLSIEDGAFMRSTGEVVIGRGSSLQEFTALAQVRNLGAPLPDFGANWVALDNFTIGNFLRGELEISHGGAVAMVGEADDVLQAGLRAHAGPGFDAFIGVDGSQDSAAINSTLTVFNDVLLGMAAGADVGVHVLDGGQFKIEGADLFLGFLPGSATVMDVTGVNAHGVRARLQVSGPDGDFSTGHCAIGESGAAQLEIYDGGEAACHTIRIGGRAGSVGYVMVDGANGGSSLTADGGLCIGGDAAGLCGGVQTGSQGTLELRNNASVAAGRGTLVGAGGRIIGSGDLAAGSLGLVVEPGGQIDPGVTVLVGAQQVAAAAPQSVQPGALTITGNVTISPTAQVKLDILGSTNHDRLVVNGNLQLGGGTLTLAFGNGHAPRQGDTYALLTATSVTGAFSNVTITGLAPGFEHELNIVNGQVVLEALNDGVPTTQPAGSTIYLPFVWRAW